VAPGCGGNSPLGLFQNALWSYSLKQASQKRSKTYHWLPRRIGLGRMKQARFIEIVTNGTQQHTFYVSCIKAQPKDCA
jgi:hypothetical protein